MAPNDFYLIVSPHPDTHRQGAEDAAGRFFYIKFGDGLAGKRYSTHNPSYVLAQNDHTAGSGTYGIPGTVHGYDSTRVGTFFEKGILKACNLKKVEGRKEWYEIRPGTSTIDNLRDWLAKVLTAFPNEKFDGDNEYTSDQKAWKWIQDCVADIKSEGFE